MINVFGSNVGKEELLKVEQTFKKQWMGAGHFVKQFETAFTEKRKLPNFSMLDNASNGLFMACSLLEAPRGSEIILPSFTCIACAQAVKMAGYTPVFCDVDTTTYNATAETIAPHITSRTIACLVVHYAGLPVDLDPIKKLGLKIIEDAAHAVDSEYKGTACGAIGDIGVYSFDPVKNLATCEGGGITCKDQKLIERAAKMRLCGVGHPGYEKKRTNSPTAWWEDHADEFFIKSYPNDVSAGIALAQLEKLGKQQDRRRAIWTYYTERLSCSTAIKCPTNSPPDSRHSMFTYCIEVPKRDMLAFYLLENKIYSTLRFFPIHLNRKFATPQKLEVCERLARNALNIPLHPFLSDTEVEYICDRVLAFYRKK